MDPLTRQLMMASMARPIELVASAQAEVASGSVVVSKPSGTAENDLMVALMIHNGNGTWTGDTGWTEAIDQGTSPCIRVAHKIAGSGEPSSYSFANTGSNEASGVIATFRNAAWDAIGTISTAVASSVQTAPQITVGAANSMLLAFFTSALPSVTWSSPSSGLVSLATDSSGTKGSFALYYDDLYSSGASGTKVATMSSSSGSKGCILLSVKPS